MLIKLYFFPLEKYVKDSYIREQDGIMLWENITYNFENNNSFIVFQHEDVSMDLLSYIRVQKHIQVI